MHFTVVCSACPREASLEEMVCSACGGSLSFEYDRVDLPARGEGKGLTRFASALPIADRTLYVDLGEGGTPLLRSRHYEHNVYFKNEGLNPTGSHKDRQLALALTHARFLDRPVSALVSAGSTGLAHAAYTARAGIRSVVCMSKGVPHQRVYPVFAMGSDVVEVDAPIDDVIDMLTELSRSLGLYHSSTARHCNPYQAEGAKTIAYEIVEQLGHAPDHVVVPVGGGGTIAAIGRGFRDLQESGVISHRPRLVGAVSSRFNALQVALDAGYTTQEQIRQIPDSGPVTQVQAKIAHAYPPDAEDALAELRATGGRLVGFTDEEVLDGQRRTGQGEGVYVEPSSGGCVPLVDRLIEDGEVGKEEVVVAVLCGSGFRETALTMDYRPMETRQVDAAGLEELLTDFTAVNHAGRAGGGA
jgi:threonine synthase